MTETEELKPHIIPVHRSVSQYQEYERCPELYRLKRVVKVGQKENAWLIQGTALHTAAETHERSYRTMTEAEVCAVFADTYSRLINQALSETRNVALWSGSGPISPQSDIERRFTLGWEQTARYHRYYAEKAPEEVPWVTPEDELAVELPLELDLAGVPIKVIPDQVVIVSDGLRNRDIKSGKQPGTAFQLAVGAKAIEQEYGAEVSTGDFWMGNTGEPTNPYDLSEWTTQRLTDAFGWLDENIRAENFEPKPEKSKCFSCPVKHACRHAAV